MRKIEQQLREAWLSGTSLKIDNTRVMSCFAPKTVELYLHDNHIASRNLETGITRISLAGWNSTTTRSRLCNVVGANICNIKGTAHLSGKPISDDVWIEL